MTAIMTRVANDITQVAVTNGDNYVSLRGQDATELLLSNPSERKLDAIIYIGSAETKYARTYQERAKYLLATITMATMPHPAVFSEICKIADRGL